ncbi:hypothetical protein AB0J21_18275 [Streptomyces sp. NPDC049954]|uniref:hypothetical protein n=1 Tax=Streptomyces sp. NPDC049954 TaxID=3155779 RepID=UPI00342F32D4
MLFAAPSALPEQWQYYVYSPATVGLWLLTLPIAPFVVCALTWPWIMSDDK